MDKATEKLRLGQEFEPEALIVNTLIALSHDKPDQQLIALSEIGGKLKYEYNWKPSSWALADAIRELGFEIKKAHGVMKVTIGRNLLTEASFALGMKDVELAPSIHGLE